MGYLRTSNYCLLTTDYFIMISKHSNRNHVFKPCKGTNSEKGVAVIMVLGLLSVMVLMAVSFAIVMRTERLAAGNAADTLRARELVQVGIARALHDLAVNLGPTGLYHPDGKSYPDWNATNSYTNIDASGNARWNTNICLIKGEATNYVPRALWAEATNTDLINPSNHWLAIESVAPPAPGLPDETNLMGRVAYVILNCSGLLDANYAGGAAIGLTRAGSTSPVDIAIANLNEIGDPATDFLTARDSVGGAVRYETMGELNALADINKPATNLFVYSRALPGYWNTNPPPYGYGSLGTQVNLSGSMADLTNRVNEITNAFVRVGFSQFQSGVLYSNLIDYVDDDLIPSNLEYCVESVPMINEVRVDCNINVAVAAGKYTYTLTGNVQIECWYPFLNAPDPSLSFRLNTTVQFFDLSTPIVFGALSSPSLPVYNIPVPILPGKIIPIPPQPFSFPSSPQFAATTPIAIRSIVTVSISEFPGGTIVDQLLVPVIITNFHNGVTSSNTYADIECRDPRFNANTMPNQWQQMGNTNNISLGVSNTWTKSSLSSANDGDGAMYVGNQPLHSVGELGYLVYSPSEPWKTVKLYGSGCYRVLDVFGFSTNTSDVLMTNTVFRGLVNCNPNVATDATAVVFAGMPVDQYPGGSAISNLDMGTAWLQAASIFNGGPYTNLSDVGCSFTPPGTTELQKESYFRNAFNLINLRQNMFTIIIEAQAASGGNIPGNPARQRAVAIVWRDPYTGEMFIRHIKWLGD